MTFRQALAQQRWDDHRYYHHDPVNRSLHFASALCFLAAYALLFVEPALSVLIAWLLAMPSRQIGHFFFEPREYDEANRATHAHKESIKIGYNLHRKAILHTVWVLSPLLLFLEPTLWGLLAPPRHVSEVAHNVAMVWLWVGVGAVAIRTAHLFVLYDVQTGLVWATKILTDPFHDLKLYHRAPLELVRGRRRDAGRHDAPGQSVER
jgi:hypothetical protein